MSAETQTEDRMEDDPEYSEFLSECSKHCHCCPDCHQDIPCGGVQAGGLCDEACYCSDFDTGWTDDEDE